MKVKLVVSKERYNEIKEILVEHGIDIDDDAELVLSENNRFLDNLIVKDDKIITLDQLNEGDLVSIVLVTGEGHIEDITDIFKITVLEE